MIAVSDLRCASANDLGPFANGSALASSGRNFVRYGSMLLQRRDEEMFHDLFWISFYLAKVATKNFYDGCRPFVSPRLKFTDW